MIHQARARSPALGVLALSDFERDTREKLRREHVASLRREANFARMDLDERVALVRDWRVTLASPRESILCAILLCRC